MHHINYVFMKIIAITTFPFVILSLSLISCKRTKRREAPFPIAKINSGNLCVKQSLTETLIHKQLPLLAPALNRTLTYSNGGHRSPLPRREGIFSINPLTHIINIFFWVCFV